MESGLPFVSQSLPNQVNDFNFYNNMLDTQINIDVSQSLPNQVNDFNRGLEVSAWDLSQKSQSLPNQVNDFNTEWQTVTACNPALSQSLPNQVNDFNELSSRGIHMC